MPGPLEAYLVAIGAMLFAGSCALTFSYVVRHLDPPVNSKGIRPSRLERGSFEEQVRNEALV
jgi:hypothetical protein